jgi:hypothetical protein
LRARPVSKCRGHQHCCCSAGGSFRAFGEERGESVTEQICDADDKHGSRAIRRIYRGRNDSLALRSFKARESGCELLDSMGGILFDKTRHRRRSGRPCKSLLELQGCQAQTGAASASQEARTAKFAVKQVKYNGHDRTPSRCQLGSPIDGAHCGMSCLNCFVTSSCRKILQRA